MKKVRMFGMLCFLLLPFLFSCSNENPKPNKPSTEESKLLLKFGDKVSCKDANNQSVTTGKEVKAGEKYTFTATVVQGKTIDAWYVNDARKADQNKPTFVYTVVATDGKVDGKNKAITISFKLKSNENQGGDDGKLLLKFGDKVTCKDKDNQAVTTGKEVKAGEKYTFTATVVQGQTIDAWYVNDTRKEDQKDTTFVYTVVATDGKADGKNKAITISFQLKSGENQGGDDGKLLLKFGDKVTCKDASKQDVQTGKEVKAGEKYTFTAKLGQDEELDAWCVNNDKQQDERATTFEYTVDATHGVQESGSKNKVITIKFGLMSGKFIIKFNDKVVCQDSKNETKESPVEVKVDEEFKFTPIPSVGKKLKNWTVNGTEKSGATAEEFSYTVAEADAQVKGTNKVITIGFTEVDKQKVKIKFDNTVTCTKLGASPEVNSEDSVFEGEVLTFTALQIKDTEFVHEWLKNDAKFEKKCGSEIDYKVDINDAKQDGDAKSITIKFNKREAKMVVIKFDESKIECDDESIKSGAEVKEGTKFTFTPKDESLENIFWYINDTKYTTEKDPNFIYVANDADAKDDNSKRLIEISYKDN